MRLAVVCSSFASSRYSKAAAGRSVGWLQNSRKGKLINPLLTPSLWSDHISRTLFFSLSRCPSSLSSNPLLLLFKLRIIFYQWSVVSSAMFSAWKIAVSLIFVLRAQAKYLNAKTSMQTFLVHVCIRHCVRIVISWNILKLISILEFINIVRLHCHWLIEPHTGLYPILED